MRSRPRARGRPRRRRPAALAVGADSAQTTETRAFAARLAERVAVPVELYDERFTTLIAGRDPGTPAASEDSRAAAHLLAEWLATHAGDDRPPSEQEAG